MRISSISLASSSTDKYLPGDISKIKQIENQIERFQQLIEEENQSKDDNKIKQSSQQLALNNKKSNTQHQNRNYFIGSIIDIQV